MSIINNTELIDNTCAFGELCVSIPNRADVIIGQTCYLTVSLTADSNLISSIDSISIEADKNYLTVENRNNWAVSENKNFGSAVVLLHINNNLPSDTLIKYTVHAMSSTGYINGIKSLEIEYTTKKVDPTSFIALTANNEYIEPPTKDNPVGTGSSYVTYSGILLDYNNNPLRNIQVLVSSEHPGKIFSHDQSKTLVNIGTEPEDGKLSQKIMTHSQSSFDFFAINSDTHGNIKFRVYPVRDTSVRIDFDTQILNVTSVNYSASIYVFNAIRSSSFGPTAPKISGIQNGKVEKIPGAKGIEVHVSSYPGGKDTDSLIFFMQGFNQKDKPIQLKPIYRLDNITSLDTIPLYFTYDQLPLNKPMKFYYLVAPENQEYSYSMTEMFTYIGEQNDSSNEDVYDKVKVYTSRATLPIDVYSEENETFEWHGIILSMINSNKKPGKNAKGVTGLYVVIMGTNDQNNKNLPQLGSKGYLNVYIKTPTSRNTHKSYQFSLSTADSGKQTGHVIVNIPYCDINRAGPSFSKGLGTLSFDYYIENSDGSKTYSKKWTAKINTVLPNQAHDNNDGCDPL
ncbi:MULTISPECIES: hypothetical protein [Xenorhabdus]|uniref:Inverse autotransporter beta-barrel domain-containing protein n=1 Tax=Xenorhabdus ehlersii TaxID=290111 RepID=A0A2D0INR0_9GAMM|nr:MULTISPECIES: hypothetical protein [Xenorhabdus]MBC8950495.1 hypothetical protein [Xenorhabdus sp. TS4]PHM23481.1 hypothetical protein Xehl_02750 [Xenorhabdus ehlersii]RKE90703.1 hypothetical protein BDE27_2598 [Xenorhabdus ehlersii]